VRKIKIKEILELEDYSVNLEINSKINKNSDYSFIIFDEKDKLDFFKISEFPFEYSEFVEYVYDFVNKKLSKIDLNLSLGLRIKIATFVTKWFLLINNVVLTLKK